MAQSDLMNDWMEDHVIIFTICSWRLMLASAYGNVVQEEMQSDRKMKNKTGLNKEEWWGGSVKRGGNRFHKLGDSD